jgi:hypothetical protein
MDQSPPAVTCGRALPMGPRRFCSFQSRVSFYLSAARVPANGEDRRSLPWLLVVQEWQGRWNRPDCRRNDSGVPRGQWAICGDGPSGLAIPAPTPDGSVRSGWAVAWLPPLFPRLLTAVIL